MLTAQRLRELLGYDQEIGEFHRLTSIPGSRYKEGQTPGYNHQGYVVIGVDGKQYKRSRLAWLWTHGEWPSSFLDHINGIRDDDRISNLRQADNALNMQNQKKAHKNNHSGFLGVHPMRKRFSALLTVQGKRHYLGGFDTPEAAHAAYLQAKRVLHPGNTL